MSGTKVDREDEIWKGEGGKGRSTEGSRLRGSTPAPGIKLCAPANPNKMCGFFSPVCKSRESHKQGKRKGELVEHLIVKQTTTCKIGIMKTKNNSMLTRRGFLVASLTGPVFFLYGLEAAAGTRELEPTPVCGDRDDATPPQTPGPFYKPRSPERQSLLEPGIQGTRIVLEGHVRSAKCKLIERTLVDFWHADASGVYDNAGYRLRGHQFTDGGGRYRLETIVPGLYPGRTRHFHVRLQAPNRPILTTQLYFPGEPENKRDSIFNPKLVLRLRDSAAAKAANFDFVLDLG